MCHKFHDYLYRSKFHVLTYNSPLTYVLTTARLDATGHRWLAALSAYDFDITYRAAQHSADDVGLSRRPHEGHIEDPMRERQQRYIASLLLNNRPQRQVDIVDASAVVNAVLDGQAIPAAGGFPIMDSAVLDQQSELEVSRMPSLTVAEQRDAQLSDPNIARVRELLESAPMSQRELKTESREVAAMMRVASTLYFCNQTARGVAEVLWKEFFLDFGFPRRLHSDRGASFTCKLMRELAKQTGVRSSYTTPYHPEGNAVCERYNRTLIGMIATLNEAHKQKWSEHIRYLSHAYNCTQHDATGFQPFYLMFLRYPRLKVDWLFANDSEQDSRGPSSIQYVNELRERLSEAYALADEHARAQGQANKRRYDHRAWK